MVKDVTEIIRIGSKLSIFNPSKFARSQLKLVLRITLFMSILSKITEEIVVAKRRNLKKEKAERNQAYARQFRQKSSRFSSRGRNHAGNQNGNNNEGQDKDE